MLQYVLGNSDALVKGFLLFVGFAVFHTVCAQNIFKDILGKLLSDFFVKYFWRLVYVLISIHLYFNVAAAYLYSSIQNVYLIPVTDEMLELSKFLHITGKWMFYIVLVQMDFLYYFGLKQAFFGILILLKIIPERSEAAPYNLQTGWMYRIVRHPMYLGLLVMMLAQAHTFIGLLSVSLIVLYLIVGLPIEERKLVSQFGKSYTDYRAKTPAIIPVFGHLFIYMKGVYRK